MKEKIGKRSTGTAQQIIKVPSNETINAPSNEIINVPSSVGYAICPPMVTETQILGYVNETNGVFHSRDIAVPFSFSGRIYLIFGDTFCKNSNNEYVGLVSNTAAIIEDRAQPTKSKYLEAASDGKIKPFIDVTPFEFMQEKRDESVRVALWSFGGGVEVEDGTARVWYAKTLAHKDGRMEYIGTGVAYIAPRFTGRLGVGRPEGLVFGPQEPRVGTFSSILNGDFIYLYGDNGNNNIVLARVPTDIENDPLMCDKNSYMYWNGAGYVQDPSQALAVFNGVSQGSVVRTKLFGPEMPFLFVGNGAWGSSKILMGASPHLEGPWDLKEVCMTSGIKIKDKYRYCIYPHIWASDEEKAELVVSWSEPYPGGVIMARLKLAPIVDSPPHEQSIH